MSNKKYNEWWIGIGGGGVFNEPNEYSDFHVVEYQALKDLRSELEQHKSQNLSRLGIENDYQDLKDKCEKIVSELKWVFEEGSIGPRDILRNRTEKALKELGEIE